MGKRQGASGAMKGILLTVLVVFILFGFPWRSLEAEYSGALPALKPDLSSEREADFATPQLSYDIVEEITSRSIFSRERNGGDQEALQEILSESTILIGGGHKLVQLVGTLGTNEERIAAISVGEDEIIWVRRNEVLGDWRVENITRQGILLSNRRDILMLQQRTVADLNASSGMANPQ